MMDFISPLVLLVVAIILVLLSVCLYEVMVFSVAQIGSARYSKFVSQTAGVIVAFYFICNVSEHANDCNWFIESR